MEDRPCLVLMIKKQIKTLIKTNQATSFKIKTIYSFDSAISFPGKYWWIYLTYVGNDVCYIKRLIRTLFITTKHGNILNAHWRASYRATSCHSHWWWKAEGKIGLTVTISGTIYQELLSGWLWDGPGWAEWIREWKINNFNRHPFEPVCNISLFLIKKTKQKQRWKQQQNFSHLTFIITKTRPRN